MPSNVGAHRTVVNPKDSCGLSLIEVMIAAFVLSTGILGLAGLQMKSLNMISNSNMTNIAMVSLNNMADRMRSNHVAVFDGFYDNIHEELGDQTDNPNCGTDCAAPEIAQYDTYAVFEQLREELPQPTLSVQNTGNNIFTITITWEERVGNSDAEIKQHQVSILPYQP